MKKMTEVTEITGISRRVLQGYAKDGFILPSNFAELDKYDKKNRKIPWLYDDETIYKLMAIQFFSEIGYQKDEIADVLSSNSLSLVKEMRSAKDKLLKKLRRIQADVVIVDILEIYSQMIDDFIVEASQIHADENIETAITSFNFNDFMFKTSFIDYEEYMKKKDFYCAILFAISILNLKGYRYDSDIIKCYMSSISKKYIEIYIEVHNDEISEETKKIMKADIHSAICVYSMTVLKIYEVMRDQYYELLCKHFGIDEIGFLIDTLNYYKEEVES